MSILMILPTLYLTVPRNPFLYDKEALRTTPDKQSVASSVVQPEQATSVPQPCEKPYKILETAEGQVCTLSFDEQKESPST